MNSETPQSNDPGRQGKTFPKMMWLLVALVPAALIMLFEAHGGVHGEGAKLERFVALGLNPAMTCVACYGLLRDPYRSKVIPLVGAVFLGALFAVFNMVIGVLGGCAFGGAHIG